MARVDQRFHAGPEPSRKLDLYAGALSSLCLLHCLLLPMLATLMPVAALVSEVHWVHRLLVVLAAPATLWVVWNATPIENTWPFVVAALGGLALLLLAAFAGNLSAHEEQITVAGAVILGAAHSWRWMRHRGGDSIGPRTAACDKRPCTLKQ